MSLIFNKKITLLPILVKSKDSHVMLGKKKTHPNGSAFEPLVEMSRAGKRAPAHAPTGSFDSKFREHWTNWGSGVTSALAGEARRVLVNYWCLPWTQNWGMVSSTPWFATPVLHHPQALRITYVKPYQENSLKCKEWWNQHSPNLFKVLWARSLKTETRSCPNQLFFVEHREPIRNVPS